MRPWTPISDAARSVIKAAIVNAALARLITAHQAERLIARLGLRDA